MARDRDIMLSNSRLVIDLRRHGTYVASYHGFAMREVSVNSISLLKALSFQSKASVVCSVTAAIFIDFCLKKLNVFSQHIGKKKWKSEFRRTNPQELKCWSSFCVNYFLRYYLMMQHQPIVKRVNGTHEWAHRPYQLLSALYHCCLYKHMRQDERRPLQSSCLMPICT